MAPVDTSGTQPPRLNEVRSSTSGSFNVKTKEADLEGLTDTDVRSDSETDAVGRQIQLEAENSIKYRTCSWQKVCSLLVAYGSWMVIADCP